MYADRGNMLTGIEKPPQMNGQGIEYRGLREQCGQRRWQKPGVRTVLCDGTEEGECSDQTQRRSCVQNTCTNMGIRTRVGEAGAAK